MFKDVGGTGLCFFNEKEAEFLYKQYGKTIEEIIDNKLDYEKVLDNHEVVYFLDTTYEGDGAPLEVESVFVNEGEKYNYTARLITYAHWTIIELTYKDGSKKYIYNDREAWPQTFDEGIACGDLLFCAEEEGYTKEDCFNFLRDFLKVNYNYKFELDKDKLTIMEGL